MPVGGLSSTLRQAAELRASMTTASSDSSPRPIHRQNTMPTNNNYSYEPAQMIIPQQSYLPNQSHGSSVNHNESVGYESINVYENDPSSNRQGQRHSDRHPQENPATYSSSASKNTNSIHSHRQAWQTHGLGLTQALADHRRQHGGWKVKLTQAVQRLEIGSNTRYYTAYLLQVTAPPETTTPVGSSWTVERRYSEFAKLHDLLDRHNIRISTVNFPSKHNMGRWLITGGHQSQEDVTQYRLIQLDVWMVHVVDWYNTYCEQPQQDVLATAFNKFLTQSFQPPCLDENYLPSNLERSLWSTSWKWHNPICSTLGSSLRQATWTIQQMTTASMDQSIPVDLLQAARGLLFLTVVKAGMVVSGRVGTGLVVARLASSTAGSTTSDAEAASWSAPCAVGTVGMGWGALIGGDVTHYLIVLTTDQAVLDLVSINKSRSVQLGAELGVAVGPVGRGATGHVAVSVL
jgi:lipid-binding SYLF domain-containing protein